jgi:carboxyl-terminal processing protease
VHRSLITRQLSSHSVVYVYVYICMYATCHRTFNGLDWFKLRQELVKHSYKTDEEVYAAIKTSLAKLGDKYTRYLPPPQYAALVNSATGELTGVGVQLVEDSSGHTVISKVEEGSPAAETGLLRDDVIFNVDGTDAEGLSPEEIAALLRYGNDM